MTERAVEIAHLIIIYTRITGKGREGKEGGGKEEGGKGERGKGGRGKGGGREKIVTTITAKQPLAY